MPMRDERKKVLEDIFYSSQQSRGSVSNLSTWVEAFYLLSPSKFFSPASLSKLICTVVISYCYNTFRCIGIGSSLLCRFDLQ